MTRLQLSMAVARKAELGMLPVCDARAMSQSETTLSGTCIGLSGMARALCNARGVGGCRRARADSAAALAALLHLWRRMGERMQIFEPGRWLQLVADTMKMRIHVVPLRTWCKSPLCAIVCAQHAVNR